MHSAYDGEAVPIAAPAVSPLRQQTARKKPGLGLGWRWSILLIMPLGYLFTDPRQFAPTYTAWTIAATICLTLLLHALRRPLIETFPIWIMLFVFLAGYYIQFYLFEFTLSSNGEWRFDSLWLPVASSVFLMSEAFSIFSLAFCVFAVASLVWLKMPFTKSGRISLASHSYSPSLPSRLRFLLGALVVVSLFTMFLQLQFQIGIAAAEQTSLPFRLSGLIFNIRQVLLPYFALLIAGIAYQAGALDIARWGWAFLIVHSVMQMFLLSSRGTFVIVLLPAVIWSILTRGIDRRALSAFVGIVVITCVLYPVTSNYRSERLYDLKAPFTAITMSITSFVAGNAAGESIITGALQLATRVTGLGSLLYSVRWGDLAFDVDTIQTLFFGPVPLTRWYTQEVVGFGGNVWTHLTAPGLLGAFYLLGGTSGIVIGVLLWVSVCQNLWWVVQKSKLRTRFFALSFLYVYVLVYTSEGTLDGMFGQILLLVSVMVLGEMLSHFLMRTT